VRGLPSSCAEQSAADWPSSAVVLLGAPSAIEEVERTRDNQRTMAAAVAHETGASADAAMWAVRAVLSRSFTFRLPCAFLDNVPPTAATPPRGGAQFIGNRPTQESRGHGRQPGWQERCIRSAGPKVTPRKETLSSRPSAPRRLQV